MNLSPLKAYALDKKVPIITDEALRFLETMIVKHKINDVLEIGTAIGYSALAMASFGCHVVTFERDEFMIDEAKRHFDWYDEQKRITLMPFDALTYQGELPMFDLIFIDAAKSQYQTFFKKYTPYLKKGGFVVCDNLYFHHLNPEVVNRHTQGLLKKLELFKSFLTHHPHFDTQFYDEGDGISLSRRKDV